MITVLKEEFRNHLSYANVVTNAFFWCTFRWWLAFRHLICTYLSWTYKENAILLCSPNASVLMESTLQTWRQLPFFNPQLQSKHTSDFHGLVLICELWGWNELTFKIPLSSAVLSQLALCGRDVLSESLVNNSPENWNVTLVYSVIVTKEIFPECRRDGVPVCPS